MDVNTNVINTSVNDVSTLSSAVNLKLLSGAEKVDGNQNGSFTVDSTINIQKSDLSNSLKEFVNQIGANQSNQVKLESMSTILNDIKDILNKVVASESPSVTADVYQPTIQEHMEKYNSISSDISKNFEKFQEETDSTTYFDGRLGAKPLSPSDILEAVERQMAIVNQQKEFTAKNIENIETKALNTIGEEVSKAAAEAPFEPIDFGKDIGNFSSANINNVVGSVALSQANAIPANSPKLLA